MGKGKPRKFRNDLYLIGKFVKPENINYARESKIAQQLLSLYPEIEFWKFLELGFMLNSLAYFLNGDGAAYLSKEYKISSLEIPDTPKFEIGDNLISNLEYFPIIPSTQTKTIKDFLNKN